MSNSLNAFSSLDQLVGTVVSHYTVRARLGGGSQGVVYLAHDNRRDRQVALKFLLPQWHQNDLAVERFVREAQAGSMVRHRNICQMYGLQSTADGQPFIVMAYYEGGTLRQKLEKGPLPVEEAIEIAAQVADGLAAAHAEGVVHRDIKPRNLLIAEDVVKILDFGLARLADSLELTHDGSSLGTAAYMSPEQSRGEDADARSDVWSAGAVLYEMVAGHVPFSGSHPDVIGYAIRHDPPRSLSSQVRGVPLELEAVVLRALRKEPAHRFQTARDMARALRRLQADRAASRTPWSDRVMTCLRQSRTRWVFACPLGRQA